MPATLAPLRRLAAGVLSLGIAGLAAASAALAGSGSGHAGSSVASDAPPAPDVLRVVSERGRSTRLDVALQEYASADGTGPTVILVGVTHIADPAYYDALQLFLDDCDLVLYESVGPPGASGGRGTDAAEQIQTTRGGMRFVGQFAAMVHHEEGIWPTDLDDLAKWAGQRDARIEDFLVRGGLDAWGRPVQFEPATGLGGDGGALVIRSLGPDGKANTTFHSDDLLVVVSPEDVVAAGAAGGGGSIQEDLADALGLEFQLTSMNYDRPHWVPSDLAADEVNAAMVERGVSFELLENTLGGTSFPARVAKVMLGVVKIADRLTGGAASTAMKVMLVEMLSDESLIESSMDQLGAGFGEVILGERNQRVMDDLAEVLAVAGDRPARIAIFYGAAHLPDFTKRLAERFDYVPAGEPTWLPAITVDLESSPVSQRDIDMIRGMVRRQLKAMQQMQGG